MAKKEEEKKKAAKAAARERVSNRLAKGKNVSVSDISEKTGVSEKRAQRIINRAEAPSLNSSMFEGTQNSPTVGPEKAEGVSANKYFEKNDIDPGKRLGKKEAKKAIKAGVSAYNLGKFADNLSGGASDNAQTFLDKKKRQVSTKMEDYDTTTAGGKRFTKADIRYLMSEEGGGHSMDAIQKKMDSYQNDTSVKVGLGAQDFLDKKVKQMNSSNEDDARLGSPDEQAPPAPPTAETPPTPPAPPAPPTAETPPTPPAPQPEQTPAPAAPAPATQTSAISNGNFNNSNNDVTDSIIYGNNNQGSDFSVNISGDASDNMKNAVGYSAINDNAFARSQSQLNGLSRSSQAIAAANEQTGASQGIANLDYVTRLNSLKLGNQATQAQVNLYGDLFKFEAPEYKMPKPGKKPEDKTKEIADMYSV
jgi:hypothetical protein